MSEIIARFATRAQAYTFAAQSKSGGWEIEFLPVSGKWIAHKRAQQ